MVIKQHAYSAKELNTDQQKIVLSKQKRKNITKNIK